MSCKPFAVISRPLARNSFYSLLLTAYCLLLIISCGIKAPPLPPEEFAPEKITDLEVYTKNNEVILKWAIPTRRVDDTKLLDLDGFEVYRKEQGDTEEEAYIPLYRSVPADKQIDYSLETEVETEELINTLEEPQSALEAEGPDKDEKDVQHLGQEEPADFIKLPSIQERGEDEYLVGYERIDQILLERLEGVELEDDYVIYKDRSLSKFPEGLKADRGYSYLVISFDKSGLPSQPSNIAQVWLSPTPDPPTNLVAIRGEGKAWLAWSPPRARVDGTPLTELEGFNLYRKGGGDNDYPFYPLNEELIKDNSYVDTGLTNGETYVYVVRAVTTDALPWHEGPASNEVAVTLRDTYPPLAPQGLVGVNKGDGIVLNWNPNSEPDLLGYYVYRKSTTEEHYQRITTSPISETTFRDQDIQPGQVYFYAITAVDNASPPNESPFSEKIQVFPIKRE